MTEVVRDPSGQALAASPSSPVPGLAPLGFDPSRVRGWLVAMTRQGEDQVWRGATNALAAYDALEREASGLRIVLWNTLCKVGVHQDLAIQIINEAAQGMAARSDETGTGSAVGNSPVAESDAPTRSSPKAGARTTPHHPPTSTRSR